MSFDVHWHDSTQRYLVLRGYNLVSWDEVYEGFTKTSAFIEDIQHPIITILMFDDFPKGLVLPHVKQIALSTPAVIHGSVIVLDSKNMAAKFIEIMIRTVIRVSGSKDGIVFVHTFEEALEAAEKMLSNE